MSMPDTVLSPPDVEARLRQHAARLGLADERAIAVAVDHYARRARRGAARPLEDARDLLGSWWRHPSNGALLA